jgi:hypothetical protein
MFAVVKWAIWRTYACITCPQSTSEGVNALKLVLHLSIWDSAFMMCVWMSSLHYTTHGPQKNGHAEHCTMSLHCYSQEVTSLVQCLMPMWLSASFATVCAHLSKHPTRLISKQCLAQFNFKWSFRVFFQCPVLLMLSVYGVFVQLKDYSLETVFMRFDLMTTLGIRWITRLYLSHINCCFYVSHSYGVDGGFLIYWVKRVLVELQRFPSSQPFGIQYEFHLQVFLFSPFSILS